MTYNFTPTIDFTTDELVLNNPANNNQKFLNMVKPIGIKPPVFEKNQTESGEYIKELALIDSHILKVLCSNNKSVHEYFLNWMACSFAGRKLRKAIYLQSEERTGKGIFLNFIHKILGERMYKTSSVETITKYTKQLEGRTLINFDELPSDQTNFRTVSDSLKGLITEPTFECRMMHNNGYTQKNTFNIIITTNNDAILFTQSNNSRYVCLDVSDCEKGNETYFKNLYEVCSEEGVMKAFYFSMIERFKTLNNWNEDIIPESETKKMKVIESLPKIYKYLKDKYILNNKGFHIKTKTFFECYYTETNDKTTKNKLGRYLKKINITPIKKADKKNKESSYYVYKISFEDLKAEFVKNKWLDDMVDHIDESSDDATEYGTACGIVDDENREDEKNPLDYMTEEENPMDYNGTSLKCILKDII